MERTGCMTSGLCLFYFIYCIYLYSESALFTFWARCSQWHLLVHSEVFNAALLADI